MQTRRRMVEELISRKTRCGQEMGTLASDEEPITYSSILPCAPHTWNSCTGTSTSFVEGASDNNIIFTL